MPINETEMGTPFMYELKSYIKELCLHANEVQSPPMSCLFFLMLSNENFSNFQMRGIRRNFAVR